MERKTMYTYFDEEAPQNYALDYFWDEKNSWYFAVDQYTMCYQRYFKFFSTMKDLEEELVRPDMNTICHKELTELKKAGPGITYREMLGRMQHIINIH